MLQNPMLEDRFEIITPPENVLLMQFVLHLKENNLLKNIYGTEMKKSKPSGFNRMV